MPRLRLKVLRTLLAAASLCGAGSASAGVLFAPHLAEYGRSLGASSREAAIVFFSERGGRYYGADGSVLPISNGTADVEQINVGLQWTDKWFSNTGVPFFASRFERCSLVFGAGHAQGDSAAVAHSEELGLNAGANQFTNLLANCLVQDDTRRVGPFHGHVQFGGAVRVPIGGVEEDNLLNFGTSYWTYIPHLELHAESGRWYIDGIADYQFNTNPTKVTTLGLSPTRAADWWNTALNVGYRLTSHWFADVGFSYNASVGSNGYDKVDVHNEKPIGVDTCLTYGLPQGACASGSYFYYQSRPGPYEDGGAGVRLASASIYYFYRASGTFAFRVYKSLSGYSGQYNSTWDICTEKPCGPSNAELGQITVPLPGAGDLAGAGAGTIYELTLVFPLGAP